VPGTGFPHDSVKPSRICSDLAAVLPVGDTSPKLFYGRLFGTSIRNFRKLGRHEPQLVPILRRRLQLI